MYQLLVRKLSPVQSSLILLAFDLIVAGVCAYFAMNNKPDPIEIEARLVRQQAILELKQSLAIMSLASEVTGAVLRRRSKSPAGPRPRSTARMIAELASRLLPRR